MSNTEFEFGQKGWAWDDEPSEAMIAIYLETNNNDAHLVAIKGVRSTYYWANFQIEKPCQFNVGDVIEHVDGRICTYIRQTARQGYYSMYLHEHEKPIAEINIHLFTLLYTAEQLDDKSVYDKFAGLKFEHSKGKVIQWLDSSVKADEWIDGEPEWEETCQYRVKPEPEQPKVDGFDLNPIKVNKLGELVVVWSENDDHVMWVINEVVKCKNFAGYVYNNTKIPVSHVRMWADSHGSLFEHYHKGFKLELPKYVAWIRG